MKKALITATIFLVITLLPTSGAQAGSRWQKVPLELQWITAVHESAHAVVGLVVNPSYQFRELAVAGKTSKKYDELGKTSYLYGVQYAKTPVGAIAMAASRFAGAKAEKLLLGLEATGVRDDLMSANKWCQTQEPVSECLDTAQKLAEKVILRHARTIKILAELALNQPISRKDGYRHLRDPDIQQTILKSLLQDPE